MTSNPIDPEQVARTFHEEYEALAPLHDYETREASAKPWSAVPRHNRELMTETARAVMHRLSLMARPDAATLREQIARVLFNANRKAAYDVPKQKHYDLADAVMAVLADHGQVEREGNDG